MFYFTISLKSLTVKKRDKFYTKDCPKVVESSFQFKEILKYLKKIFFS